MRLASASRIRVAVVRVVAVAAVQRVEVTLSAEAVALLAEVEAAVE